MRQDPGTLAHDRGRLSGALADTDYVKLSGAPQPTPWDPALAEAMASAGRAVYEEAVADALITDLAS